MPSCAEFLVSLDGFCHASKPKLSIGYGGALRFGLNKAQNRNTVKSHLYIWNHARRTVLFVVSISKKGCFCEASGNKTVRKRNTPPYGDEQEK